VDVLIDANVIVGYYKEDVLGFNLEQTGLTGLVTDLVNNLQQQGNTIILDRSENSEEGQIFSEWSKHIPKSAREWFNAWFIKMLDEKRIVPIPVDQHLSANLLQRLYRLSFPNSVDKWYIRTAKTRAVSYQRADAHQILVKIISEDIDFFDPCQKDKAKGKHRIDILMSEDSPIPVILRPEGIDVCCVCNY